jgi:hypothetical protein
MRALLTFFRFAIKAAGHRGHFGLIIGHRGRLWQAKQGGGVGQNVFGAGGIIVADVIDATGVRVVDRPKQRFGNVIDVNAAEHLTGLNDTPGAAIAHLFKRATAGAIDARQPEDMHRQNGG